MDAAQYMHVIPGLIVLKYLSDAFTEKRIAAGIDYEADPDFRDTEQIPFIESIDDLWPTKS